MRTNKEKIYNYIVKKSEGAAKTFFYTEDLSKELDMQRSNLSAILNQLVDEKRLVKDNSRPVKYQLINHPLSFQVEDSCFRQLIGHETGLSSQVRLAKAAILYPQYSLPSLIHGEDGTGKTIFANYMHKFAKEKGVLPKDADIHVIDGESFNNNLTLEENIESFRNTVTEATAGTLLIEQIDACPMPLVKLIMDQIDRYISTQNNRFFICTTSDRVKSDIEYTLGNRFSVIINLPSLEDRSLEERYQFVKEYINHEADKIKRNIHVNSELLRCLLLYPCEGNIQQLRNEIKLGCANAYVREFNSESDYLYLYLSDFPTYIRKGFLFYKENKDEIEELIPTSYSYTFTGNKMNKIETGLSQDENHSIYEMIDSKVTELKKRGITQEDINTIISIDIDNDIYSFTKEINRNRIDKDVLSSIIDTRVIQFVDNFLNDASKELARVFPEAVYSGLSLTLSSAITNEEKGQRISNEKILEVTQNFPEEYLFCLQQSAFIEDVFDIKLSIDTIIFMTLFISDHNIKNTKKNKPVILIAMHGENAAQSIANTVNQLVKVHNTHSFDLPIDKNVEDVYQLFKKKIIDVDEGKGVLILYDMGSFVKMGELVKTETGIPIEMIQLSATLTAMEVSRIANFSSSLEELRAESKYVFEEYYKVNSNSTQEIDQTVKNVIVTLCATGEGTAKEIKRYIEKNMDLSNTQVVALAIGDKERLIAELNRMKKDNHLQCIVGTYNPGIHGIPFISLASFFETPIDKLPILLTTNEEDTVSHFNFQAMYDYLSEQMPELDMLGIEQILTKAIANIKKTAKGLSINQEIGLLMHIASAIYRMQTEQSLPENVHKQRIISKNKRLYHDLKEIIKPLEEYYYIHFSDDEIAHIISIIKEL